MPITRSAAAASARPHRPWYWQSSLIVLLVARLALGLAYSQMVPAWEAYDEDGHFAYAGYLGQHHTLTLPANDPAAAQIWEKFQPPLYYNLIAPVIALFAPGAAFPTLERNPYFADGDAGVNYALHPVPLSEAERSLELGLRAARVVSVLISTLSVVAVYLAAGRLWPNEKRTIWAATLLYAFWPQFLFVGSMVTNDVLITALAAVAVWQSVSLVVDGFHLRPALVLGAVVGAALVTKLNGAALIVLALGALILSLRPGRTSARPASKWPWLLGLGGLAALVVGALWVLSSLKFVTAQVVQLATLRDFAANLSPGGQNPNAFVGTAVAYAFRTFFASYGWGNLETFGWLYPLWALGAVVAVAGGGLAAWRRLRGRSGEGPTAQVGGLLATFALTLFGLALGLAISQHSIYLVPGRYLLPALPAVAILLVGGWSAFLPAGRRRRIGWQSLCLGLTLVGWLVPFRILAPAYARPWPAPTSQVDTQIGAIFGSRLELLGYDGALPAVAGDHLQATLCWQATAPVTGDDTLFLEVVGADGQGYGRLRTYPGRGNYPTSQWTPGVPFCESYTVMIGSDIPAPALAHLRVSWLAGIAGNPLPLRLASGSTPNDPAVAIEFKVASRPGYVPPIAHDVDFRLGQQIRLTGYDLAADGQQVRVTLRWEALEDITANDVVFAHLRDTPDHAFAQGDSLPRQGAYPTRLWKKGEIILDTHLLNLPAGRPTPPLALYVGLVDQATGARLIALDAAGNELPNDEVVLATGVVFH